MGNSLENHINHPDYKEFLNIRKKLEENIKDFPKKGSLRAAIELKKKFGYKIIFGYFKPKIDVGYFKLRIDVWDYPHVWNYDPKKENYIDLSADKFTGISEKILITSSKNSPYHKKNFIENIFKKCYYMKKIFFSKF